MDLKKAFDCVDHEIILKKLFLYGFTTRTLEWFRSYLSNSIQICKIGQSSSGRRTIQCGILQGSNLGSLLFLVYINDLPRYLSHLFTSIFANDTNLTINGSLVDEVENKLNIELEKVHQLLLADKLTLNKEKTEYMIIGSRQRLDKIENDPEIKLWGVNIKRVKHTKTLGIFVDEQLQWKNQIESIITKVSRGIGMLRRIKKYVPKSISEKVYKAIVLPHFDYCSFVWDNCSVYLQAKLQKMPNRTARVITGKPYDTRISDMLNMLHWQPLVW